MKFRRTDDDLPSVQVPPGRALTFGRRLVVDAVKHDVRQHVARQERQTAGQSLYGCEGAACRSVEHRKPNVFFTKASATNSENAAINLKIP